MLYQALRATAAIALRWYYADVFVQGAERMPRRGPLLVIANHPNALIDPLLVGTIAATTHPAHRQGNAVRASSAGDALQRRWRGAAATRQGRSEARSRRRRRGTPSRERNSDTFRLVTAALRQGEAVLVFPEGISHDHPEIAPLKSGAARMALQARSEATIGIRILPMGLIFEAKERPGSRVLVRVGEPLDLDAWIASTKQDDAATLTSELQARLRAVTLNFASAERASRAVRLAQTLAAIAGAPRAVDEPRSLAAEAEIALRVDAATAALDGRAQRRGRRGRRAHRAPDRRWSRTSTAAGSASPTSESRRACTPE